MRTMVDLSEPMTAAEVITYTGIPRNSFYRYVRNGKFPKPTSGSSSDRSSRWDPDVVDAWLDDNRKSEADEASYAIEHPSENDLLAEGAFTAAKILYTHDLPVEVAYSFNFGKKKRLTAPEKECLREHLRRLRDGE